MRLKKHFRIAAFAFSGSFPPLGFARTSKAHGLGSLESHSRCQSDFGVQPIDQPGFVGDRTERSNYGLTEKKPAIYREEIQ